MIQPKHKVAAMRLFYALICAAFLSGAYASYASTAVNVNTATVQQLTSLPSIGTVKAQAIVKHRDQYGHFTKMGDLERVKGIGTKTLEKIKHLIVFDIEDHTNHEH